MRVILFGLGLMLTTALPAQVWHSAERPPAVIELFTSEGCSSCPPADRWLASFKEDPRLFRDIIPMAFHVDYWDWIGWRDRFARPEFGERQRDYVRAGRLSQRYTPGILVNSTEFQGWFSGRRRVTAPSEARGRLTVRLDDTGHLTARFAPLAEPRALTLHLVYLGNGLTTEVKRGENGGRTLHHDFVVLDHFQTEGRSAWSMALPAPSDRGQTRTALVAWVSPIDQPRILQAVGGYLTAP